MASSRQGKRSTRGRFLGLASVGVGGSIAALAGVPAAAYLLAPAVAESRFRPVALGRVDDFVGERQFAPTAAPYVEEPTEPVVSSGLAYVHYTGGRSRDWLHRDAMFVIFSNRCMHVGCPVAATGIGFSCPCHGGQYDQAGRRTAGPPIRPLDRFRWELRDGGEGELLWITDRWSVEIEDGQVRYYPVHAPGQPIDLPGPAFVSELAYPAVTYRQGKPPA
jgi:quinol---cytochrome c reductase iron-sulfur subunit, bacillus type